MRLPPSLWSDQLSAPHLMAPAHSHQPTLTTCRTWTGEMVTDNPGTWLLHCHVNDHFTAGMQVRCCTVELARMCQLQPCAASAVLSVSSTLAMYAPWRAAACCSEGLSMSQALFTLEGKKQPPFEFTGVERTFYIQVSICWNIILCCHLHMLGHPCKPLYFISERQT
jgi:Multicopper oxidase